MKLCIHVQTNRQYNPGKQNGVSSLRPMYTSNKSAYLFVREFDVIHMRRLFHTWHLPFFALNDDEYPINYCAFTFQWIHVTLGGERGRSHCQICRQIFGAFCQFAHIQG